MAKNNRIPDRIQAVWNLLGGDETIDLLLNGKLELSIEAPRCLSDLVPFVIPASKINPLKFFETRLNFRSSDDFYDLILSNASNNEVSIGESVIGYADLRRDSNDSEIAHELPEGFVFQSVDICLVYLITMIEGEMSPLKLLLTKESRPISFRVRVNAEVVVMNVGWDYGDQQLIYSAYRLDDNPWIAGCRIFSAAIA